MVFGNVGRFGNLQSDLQPTLDATTAALAANQGLSVIGGGTLPALVHQGGLRVEVPPGSRILPYVLGSVGVARLNPTAQFAFAGGNMPDGSTPAVGTDVTTALVTASSSPTRRRARRFMFTFGRRRAGARGAALGRRRGLSLLAHCGGLDAERVAAEHERDDVRIRLSLLTVPP